MSVIIFVVWCPRLVLLLHNTISQAISVEDSLIYHLENEMKAVRNEKWRTKMTRIQAFTLRLFSREANATGQTRAFSMQK